MCPEHIIVASRYLNTCAKGGSTLIEAYEQVKDDVHACHVPLSSWTCIALQAAIAMFGYMTELDTVQEASSLAIQVEGIYRLVCKNLMVRGVLLVGDLSAFRCSRST